jgi:TetR/AcrR family transcriptional regulator, cholesterol catabolism regulator
VAIELWSERGYRRTSLKDIAQQLRITEPALYHYFASKEELLATIYLDALDRALASLESIRSSSGKADEMLGRVIEEFTAWFTENPMFRIFFRERDELSNATRKKIVAGEREWAARISAIISDGVKAGIFRSVPPSVVTFAIAGMTAWVNRWYRPNGPLRLRQVSEVLTQLVLTGLRDPAANLGTRANGVEVAAGSRSSARRRSNQPGRHR